MISLSDTPFSHNTKSPGIAGLFVLTKPPGLTRENE